MTVMIASLGSAREGRPRALIKVRDPEAARRAIELLEASGIDGNDVAMASATGPVVVRDREDSDEDFMLRTTHWIVLGVVTGMMAGAVLGAVVAGVELLAWPGGLANGWWTFALASAWFAAGGGVLGGFVALARKTGFSEAWPATFDSIPQPVWIAVFGERPLPATGIDALDVVFDPDVEIRHPDAA